MLSFEEYRDRKLSDPAFAEEYERLALSSAIAAAVIRLRIERDLTQAELAKLVGTRQSAISRVESGRHMPSLAFIARIGHALGAEVEIGFNEKEQSENLVQTKA